jgi:hypothetical protein
MSTRYDRDLVRDLESVGGSDVELANPDVFIR